MDILKGNYKLRRGTPMSLGSGSFTLRNSNIRFIDHVEMCNSQDNFCLGVIGNMFCAAVF